MWTNNIDPVLANFSVFSIRWYGLLLAFGVSLAALNIVKRSSKYFINKEKALDLCLYLIIGGLIGARLGEVIFYEPSFYFSHPLEIFFINHGGLSSHGMALGLIISYFIFTKINKLDWKVVADLIVPAIPLLAFFIRIGNFTNSEIMGRVTTLPWGVIYPRAESLSLLRHPIQLYEAGALLVIFFVMYFLEKIYLNKWKPFTLANTFILIYFGSRFFLEFFKAEYSTAFGITMGQILSIPFIIFSLGYIFWVKKLPR